VGDDQDGTGIFTQVMLQPVDAFSIQVVGRLVEQQQVRLAQKKLGQRHTAALTTRQFRHVRITGRAAQRIHRLLDLAVQIPQVLRVNLVLQGRHLVRRLVRIVHGELVVAVKNGLLFRNAFHDVAHHVLALVKLGFLRQVSAGCPVSKPRFAVKLLVDAGHDAQKRRLARAVGAKHADLGVRVKTQVDIVEHLLAAGVRLGKPVHVIDELPRHEVVRASLVICL
jgi:hypothetical protein